MLPFPSQRSPSSGITSGLSAEVPAVLAIAFTVDVISWLSVSFGEIFSVVSSVSSKSVLSSIWVFSCANTVLHNILDVLAVPINTVKPIANNFLAFISSLPPNL